MKQYRLKNIALTLILVLTAASVGAADLVIHAGTLIDGISDSPRKDVSIHVQGDKIVSIEDGFKNPAGAKIIDLSNSTILPGFDRSLIYMQKIDETDADYESNWATITFEVT